MNLYGREWTRRELEARAGRLEQLFGVRKLRLQGGFEDGVEQFEVRTGAGLRFLVTPSRGLDIGHAEYAGTPLCWHAPNGTMHPSYYSEDGADWLRTVAGGLLMTCGYRQVGSPCEDEGEVLGVHGRAHHLPAANVSSSHDLQGDNLSMMISGEMKEARLFGENLEVKRTCLCGAGENVFFIRDRIRNGGFRREPLMALYHFNFGFPLIDEHTEFEFPSGNVEPREPETPLEGYDKWQAPDANYAERVYYHSDLKADEENWTTVRIRNRRFPVGGGTEDVTVSLSWDAEALPRLVQWKMAGAGAHVMGIEPANCWVGGRADERARGTLRYLEPGEEALHAIRVRIDASRG